MATSEHYCPLPTHTDTAPVHSYYCPYTISDCLLSVCPALFFYLNKIWVIIAAHECKRGSNMFLKNPLLCLLSCALPLDLIFPAFSSSDAARCLSISILEGFHMGGALRDPWRVSWWWHLASKARFSRDRLKPYENSMSWDFVWCSPISWCRPEKCAPKNPYCRKPVSATCI